jgi:hypothetical protein
MRIFPGMKPFKPRNPVATAPARTLVQRVGDLEVAVKAISDKINTAAPATAPAATPAK